jgi:hypothetical protein
LKPKALGHPKKGSNALGEAHLGSRRKRQDVIGLNLREASYGLSLSLVAETGNVQCHRPFVHAEMTVALAF